MTELFNGRGATEGDGSNLVKPAARPIVKEALEEEVEDVVGRIEHGMPQVRGTVAPFRSAIREALGSCTEELKRLAIEMYARGRSVRDIEAAVTDANDKSLLFKSAISQVTERLWTDYQSFAGRDTGDHRLLYLFLDG